MTIDTDENAPATDPHATSGIDPMERAMVPFVPTKPRLGNQGNVATLHAAPRCGAKTRRGTACQSPAMPNGRCRIHGGTSPGGPRGEANGRYTEGLFTQEELAFWRAATRMVRGWCAQFGLTPTGLPRKRSER